MPRVASLCLPHLAIERVRRAETPRVLPEPLPAPVLPVDDDPGACSVPRGGGWRPGARWAREEDRAMVAARIAAMPSHQRPQMRELGRRSEAADNPFRAMRPDEGGTMRTVGRASVSGPQTVPLVLAARVARKEVITAACPAALVLGIGAGMALSHARALVPALDVRAADPAGDRALLDRLARHAARHWAPGVAVSGADGLWIDLTGTAHLHGGEEAFCRKAVGFLRRLGFTARIAIAETPGAAHAVARFGGRAGACIGSSEIVAALAPLPVAALRLEEAALTACRRFGFERVADLLPAPRGPLARRLGRAAIQRLDQALGRISEPIVPVTVDEPPAVMRRLLEPIATAEAIEQVVADLTRDLAAVLTERGLGVRALVLTMERVDGADQMLMVGTARATRNARHLLRLLRLKLDRIEPGLGLESARLVVTQADRLAAQALAGTLAGEAPKPELATLVDQIETRLGHGAAFRTGLAESDVPERAVRRLAPLKPGEGWPLWTRPARLLRRPEPLSGVVALLPDHPPRRFTWRGQVHEVVAGDGPERIYGEWWVRDGEVSAVRDYFRVEDKGGARFWLFRRGDGVDGATGDLSWWMHGAFG